MEFFDVVIVGGGPSGSICAFSILKNNSNLKIAIMDRETFPRDKACGDGLGPGVYNILKELGLTQVLNDHKPIQFISLTGPKGSELNSELPQVGGATPNGYVIPRRDFDNSLFLQAEKMGATRLDGWKLVKAEFLPENKIWRLHIDKKDNSNPKIVETNILIGADGSNSTVRRLLDIPFNSDRHIGTALRFYCRIKNLSRRTLRLDFTKDLYPGYGWLFPITTEMANIGVGVDLIRIKKEGINLDNIFNKYLSQLSSIYDIEVDWQSKNTYTLPYGSELPILSKGNAALIGDAGSMVNPFTGEGIYYGMYAGKLIGELISEGNKNKEDTQAVLAKYEFLFKKKFAKHFKANLVMKKLWETKFWSDIAIRACKKDKNILADGISIVMGDKSRVSVLNSLKVLVKGII